MKRLVNDDLAFLVVGTALVVYVALCTRWRDSIPGADAWEHHRAIVALVANLGHPGNPTYATDDSSIRYSPYTVAQALICRATGWSPYDVLSAAAVVNTVLLVVGVRVLLAEFGESRSAAAALIVMVALYGETPGYANSYALADLPWHQVNPSAFAFSLALFAWVLFRRAVMGGPLASLRIVAVTLLAATTLLDHAMTGLFTLIGLVLIALAARPGQHRRAFLCVVLIAAGAAALCPLWPWYRFMAALGSRSNNEYWFNKYILFRLLTRWAWPAYLCAIAALLVRRPLVPTFLLGAMLCLALALVSLVVRSPVLARLPMPAMLFLHLPIALFCHDSGLLHPLTWPGRLRALVAGDGWDRYPSVAETMVAFVLASCAIPQLMEVASAPALARPYLAPLLNKPTKLVRLRAPMDRLLARIGERDVVLSDLVTSWRIPSSRGRIVAALHYEFFVPDQARREAELERFFSPGASARDRLALIRKYHVRWIVLNSDALPRPVQDELMVPEAVVARSGGLALLDADVWARQMVLRPPDSTGRSRRVAS